jgi:cytochrome c
MTLNETITSYKDTAMRRIFLTFIIATSCVTPALADLALAQQKNCMACHAVEKKVVGPSFKTIANKYAGQNVNAKLGNKITQGGAGAWGAVPMPANPQVSPAESQTLLKWIMSLK